MTGNLFQLLTEIANKGSDLIQVHGDEDGIGSTLKVSPSQGAALTFVYASNVTNDIERCWQAYTCVRYVLEEDIANRFGANAYNSVIDNLQYVRDTRAQYMYYSFNYENDRTTFEETNLCNSIEETVVRLAELWLELNDAPTQSEPKEESLEEKVIRLERKINELQNKSLSDKMNSVTHRNGWDWLQ